MVTGVSKKTFLNEVNSICHSVAHAGKATYKGISGLVTNTDGLGYLSDFFISAIEPFQALNLTKNKTISNLVTVVGSISALLTVTTILADLRMWMCPDESGKYLIKRAWYKVGESGFYTVNHVIDLVWFLEYLKLISPITSLTPLVYARTIFKTLACVCGIFGNIRCIHKCHGLNMKYHHSQRINTWRQRQGSWKSDRDTKNRVCDEKLRKWNEIYNRCVGICPDKTHETAEQTAERRQAKFKLKQWSQLKICPETQLTEFCKSKKNRWKDRKYNVDLKMDRSIFNLAINIATIALTLFTIGLMLSGLGTIFWIEAMIFATTCGAYFFDLLSFWLDQNFCERKLKTTILPLEIRPLLTYP